ncbi:MAG: DUF5591 domain-containing protein [Candidatus Micrarchaeota archaeon]
MTVKTLILSSGKCSWGKCFACGWGQLEAPFDMEACKRKVQAADIGRTDELKIFASGSFLDNKQFSPEFRKWFADYVREKGVKKLTIESRPEFVTDDSLKDFTGLELNVAIGLECADNTVLKNYGKGFTKEDFAKAAELLHERGHKVRTYLMVNMPFSKPENLDPSVEFADKYSDSIVLINTFPHSKAKLFDLWISGKWKPISEDEFNKLVQKYKHKPHIETDAQNYMFLPKFPNEQKKLLKGATSEILNHPFFNVWQDYFERFYKPPADKKFLLFLPCSARKPYSRSQTHMEIFRVLKQTGAAKQMHSVVVSTPGVIPMEFNGHYPFSAYDWPEWEETPEIRKEYTEVTMKRVFAYLKAHKNHYKHVYCYLKPDSDTYKAVSQACEELGIALKNLLDVDTYEQIKAEKNPVARVEALASLRRNLADLKL